MRRLTAIKPPILDLVIDHIKPVNLQKSKPLKLLDATEEKNDTNLKPKSQTHGNTHLLPQFSIGAFGGRSKIMQNRKFLQAILRTHDFRLRVCRGPVALES